MDALLINKTNLLRSAQARQAHPAGGCVRSDFAVLALPSGGCVVSEEDLSDGRAQTVLARLALGF